MRFLQKALTFDDVLLVPAHSSIMPRDVTLRARLTRNISLNLPLVSSAMDTVTESRLAIALAQEGYRVAIHEKNARIGGKLNLHREQGYTFDLGPSILTAVYSTVTCKSVSRNSAIWCGTFTPKTSAHLSGRRRT